MNQEDLQSTIPNSEAIKEECSQICDKFDEIISSPTILQRIAAMGFERPTGVQVATIPLALQEHDLLVQAQTGSGKTLAYVVPLIHRLKAALEKKEINSTYALILVPTRELAQQVQQVILSLTDNISPTVLIGGVDISPQVASLKRDPRIVVGTPGRILDLLRQKHLKLDRCRYFVLDEADEILSMGFLQDVRTILSRLPDQRQGLFVSATITPRVEMLANSFLTKPQSVLLGEYTAQTAEIRHFVCEIGSDLMAKPSALCDLIETIRPRSAIIFCNTKSDTQLVEALLRRRGFDARRINSDLTQSQRGKIMKKIRSGELGLLVATDIAARGLDIEQIDLVVNYSIHDQPEAYVHRTGRTGRAGRFGQAISLVGPKDFGAFHFLTKVLEVKFEKLPLPSNDDVVEARLSHLYGMIREKEIEITERDLLVGAKLVQELGAISEPTEELTTMCAKLCRYTIEHFISLEAKSLEEEIESSHEREVVTEYRRENSWEGEDRRRDERRREPVRGHRGESQDRRTRDRSSGGERREGGRAPEKRREKDQERREGHSFSSFQHNSFQAQTSSSEDEELRLYIGQGTADGMSEELFRELAQELAEIPPNALRRLIIREHYGFVDADDKDATALINCINGIEYNGKLLPVEYAASKPPKQQYHHGSERRSEGYSRPRSRDRGGRRDRRR